jgi:hypothetical protein
MILQKSQKKPTNAELSRKLLEVDLLKTEKGKKARKQCKVVEAAKEIQSHQPIIRSVYRLNVLGKRDAGRINKVKRGTTQGSEGYTGHHKQILLK